MLESAKCIIAGNMAKFKQIPEFLLAKLWQERASRQRSLRTGDGRRFRVIYPGRVGNTAGPDFRDAVLLEEGSGLVRGDVEIHVNQRDWLAHGHGDDPRYNGVVLHAVGGMDATTTTLHSGQQVPVLSLDSLVDRAPSKAGQAGLWPLLKPHGYLPPRSAPELGDLLDDAGDKRFLGRSGTFRVFIDEESPAQVLYSALMEALGYSQNRELFLELATRVPYSLLKKAVLKLPVQERVGVIQAMLLTASGFLPARRGRPGYRVAKPRRSTKPEARPVQSHGEKVRQRLSAPGGAMTLERWHLFRIRPQNHPVQRIIGFARLLDLFLPSAVAQPSDLPPAARKGMVEGAIGLVSAPLGSAARSQNCWSPLERGLMSTWSPLSGVLGVSGFGQFWVREIGVKKLLV